MVLSELGTEDLKLGETLEREGLDLNSKVEQWKQKGIDKIREEEINRVNYLFLTRQDAALKGMKRGREATKGLGVKSQTLHQTQASLKHRRKQGRRSNNDALHELGQMLINSGKMKALEAFSFSS